MIKELYIDGVLLDIEDFDIERSYTTPYFKDIESLKNESSYTVELPLTAKVRKVFEFCYRADMTTDIPYKSLKADYYYNGRTVFQNADVYILSANKDSVEVQFAWGLNKEKYKPLFERKLNEIEPNETTILSDDWIVKWNKWEMFFLGKKYSFPKYISGIRENEIVTINDEVQSKTTAPEPFNQNIKEMTMHPFIALKNILDLIENDLRMKRIKKTIIYQTFQNNLHLNDAIGLDDTYSIYSINDKIVKDDNYNIIAIDGNVVFFNQSIDFDLNNRITFYKIIALENTYQPIKDKVDKWGLILGGNKDNKKVNLKYEYNDFTEYSKTLKIFSVFSIYGDTTNPIFLLSHRFWFSQLITNNITFDVKFKLDFSITNGVEGITFKREKTEDGNVIVEDVFKLPHTLDNVNSKLIFDVEFKEQIEQGWFYYFDFDVGGEGVGYSIDDGGIFEMFYTVEQSIFANGIHGYGRYNCLANLPDMTFAHFINQMLKITGLFIGYDNNGDFKFFDLENFKDNLDNANIYDWSKKYFHSTKKEYTFLDMAQRNVVRYNNSDKVNYKAKDVIIVDNKNLEEEKDLIVIDFDLADKGYNDISEFILYEQSIKSSEKDGETQVSFANKFNEKPSIIAYYDNNRMQVVNDNVLPQNIVKNNYGLYQKIVNRPMIVTQEVNLKPYDMDKIDYEKPFFFDAIGQYCMLLDVQQSDNELSVGTFLIINKDL